MSAFTGSTPGMNLSCDPTNLHPVSSGISDPCGSHFKALAYTCSQHGEGGLAGMEDARLRCSPQRLS